MYFTPVRGSRARYYADEKKKIKRPKEGVFKKKMLIVDKEVWDYHRADAV